MQHVRLVYPVNPTSWQSGSATVMTCAAGDWLQGPYVYALYQHYGFDRGDIGRLFIAGFGSSMVFGTVVGALADRTCACVASLESAAVYVSPLDASPLQRNLRRSSNVRS